MQSSSDASMLCELQVVKRGSIKSVQLADRITSGREQWHDWHTEFAKNHPKYVQVRHAYSRKWIQPCRRITKRALHED